jgi:hypothetical protein
MNEREWLVACIWEVSAARTQVSLELWEFATRDWEIEPIKVDGRTVGATLVKGAEIHLASWEKPKGSARACAREVLRKVVDQWGYATTRVLADNPAGLRFCQRLGFVVDKEENGIIRLTCKEPRHA